MATKMMMEREVVAVEDEDAPRAIPSAAAWMQRPRVVERVREGGGGGGLDDKSEREYIFVVGGLECDGAESVGSVSRRYMRMKPSIRESPIQTWGVRSDGGVELKELLSPSSMWISLAEVGVAGGWFVVSDVACEGITGPGTL